MITLVSLYFIVSFPPNKLCVPVGDFCDAFIYLHHTGSCF